MFISKGNFIQLPTSDDNQQLTLTGTLLSIENGNTVDLSPLQDGVNDADSDPTNELQQLFLLGNTLLISGGNSVILSTPGTDSDWIIAGNDMYNGNTAISV
ncbi:MAG: hypothetical protein KatS3mg031_0111 [Chitinophagales bacterium]|nr:MAG: hypothetical protein KatS3mg031_0111 [Chitinophagales bacterium]